MFNVRTSPNTCQTFSCVFSLASSYFYLFAPKSIYFQYIILSSFNDSMKMFRACVAERQLLPPSHKNDC